MFDFFIKKKKIVLDCFTSSTHAYDYAPINYAYKHLPDWWKKTSKKDVIDSGYVTIKNCPSILEYYKRGIVIPSWCEFKLKIDDNTKNTYSWRSSSELKMQPHDQSQFEHFAESNGQHFKISSPWRFKTNRKIFFTWNQPVWHNRTTMFDLVILPAVINFYTQHHTNINMFSRYTEKEQNIEILPLIPIVMLHPMSECEISIVNHLVTEDDIKRIDGVGKLRLKKLSEDAVQSIRKIKHIEDQMEKTNPCPHFPKGETK
jgi:hypothetical protein